MHATTAINANVGAAASDSQAVARMAANLRVVSIIILSNASLQYFLQVHS
jgi:hypothetical protein